MGMFTSINTSASGLTAQRLRLDVIANNVANANTTRTKNGEPFRRSRVILTPKNMKVNYNSAYLPDIYKPILGNGVRVLRVEKDTEPFRLVLDPSHPDAIKSGPKKGYVQMPNVNIVEEMVDMISASRSYEANVTLVEQSKSMFNKALEIGRR